MTTRTRTVRSTAFALGVGSVVGLFAAQAPSLLILAVISSLGLALGRRPALLFGLY